MPGPTSYAESNALLYVQLGDAESLTEAADLIREMLPGERRRLAAAAHLLADMCQQELSGDPVGPGALRRPVRGGRHTSGPFVVEHRLGTMTPHVRFMNPNTYEDIAGQGHQAIPLDEHHTLIVPGPAGWSPAFEVLIDRGPVEG